MHQASRGELLAEDRSEQWRAAESADGLGPPPPHPPVVVQHALDVSEVGEELLGAPVIVVRRLQLGEALVDPADQRCPERCGRRRPVEGHGHRSTTTFVWVNVEHGGADEVAGRGAVGLGVAAVHHDAGTLVGADADAPAT